MALIDLVVEKIVKTPLESKDKPDVIRELVQIIKDAGEIDDFDIVLKAVQDREDKQSTGLTDGIAVPHAKTSAVSSLKLAIGIAPEGIDFDSVDQQPSKLFFLLLAAPGMSGPHVEALAEIAKISRSKTFDAPDTRTYRDISTSVFVPREVLPAGQWYWRYGVQTDGGDVMGKPRPFSVPSNAPPFPFPEFDELIARVPEAHPRLMFSAAQLQRLRAAAKGELSKSVSRLAARCRF